MRPRRSATLVLSCAAVALAGCGGSSLLDGDSASELQSSLSRVRTAIDDGQCAKARTAAKAGAAKVAELPSSVDAELKDNLSRGFADLSSRVTTDCETTTSTRETPTTTTTPPSDTTTSTQDTTPTEPDPSTDPTPLDPPDSDTQPLDPTTTGGTDPTLPDDGDDGSGGVTPGVDGPGAGATQRSAPQGKGNGLDKLEKRLKDARKRAEKYFRGQGGG
ncbi:hypothetical protein [Patulibacter minatonensis]|uniref:hypothetical protein n=1 Tax=Patulibacter minatonensis TaxID=298163 RepID=UPI00047E5F1E|nr:hypothetical protein [Patulibacter minatonensis]